MPKVRISVTGPRTVGAECEDCDWSDYEFSGRRAGARHATATGHQVVVVQETLITYNPRREAATGGS